MPFLTRDFLKALWVKVPTPFKPEQTDYADVWDSHEKAPRTAVLDASGETSMEIRYNGDVEPTLTKEANGEYRLDIGSLTGRVSFVWREASGTLTGSNSLKLKVRDADGSYRHVMAKVFSSTTGGEYLPQNGVTHKFTEPVVGDAVLELANISGIPGEWRIIGIIS